MKAPEDIIDTMKCNMNEELKELKEWRKNAATHNKQ